MTDAQIAAAVALYAAVVSTYPLSQGPSMHISAELWHTCKQAVLKAKLEFPTYD